MSPEFSERRALFGTLALAVIVIACLVLAVVSYAGALGQRRLAADVDELRIATQRVAAADELADFGVVPELGALDDDILLLAGDHSATLSVLPDDDAASAAHAIEEVLGCGLAAIGEGPEVDHHHAHGIVADLLDRAADTADAGAAAAERRAGVAIIVAALVGMLNAGLLARSRASEADLARALEEQTESDSLTGLANRRALQRAVEAAGAIGTTGALLVIDLDGFSSTNDDLGHDVGDEILRAVAERFRGVVRDDDVLARIGGDEFGLLLTGLPDREEAAEIAARCTRALEHPVVVSTGSEYVRASVGVAVFDDAAGAERAFTEADLAMFEAKRRGGQQTVEFEPAIEVSATHTAEITRALRALVPDRELSLVFQPIVSATDRRVVSHEVLVRWQSPTLGSISPADFIPLAERTGDIAVIGRWVRSEICRRMAAWDASGHPVDVSMNLSPLELRPDEAVDEMAALVRDHGLEPGRFTVEITESAVVDEEGVMDRRLRQLRRAGFRIAIDDFGSGYSNLGQLLSSPFDVLKVDRSLLLRLSEMREAQGGDPTGPCSVMGAIASIAATFGAELVCEGVETAEQLESLAASGVRFVQGYHTGRPAPEPVELAAV